MTHKRNLDEIADLLMDDGFFHEYMNEATQQYLKKEMTRTQYLDLVYDCLEIRDPLDELDDNTRQLLDDLGFDIIITMEDEDDDD
jgi:GTP-binding protein EngB required for normal cell division|tara:strand:+ start:18666 stop:18920 length:255 start_codon:yes stop_codon:yes gene_type:complete